MDLRCKESEIEKEYIAQEEMYFNKSLRSEPWQIVIGHLQKLPLRLRPVDPPVADSPPQILLIHGQWIHYECDHEEALSGRG